MSLLKKQYTATDEAELHMKWFSMKHENLEGKSATEDKESSLIRTHYKCQKLFVKILKFKLY